MNAHAYDVVVVGARVAGSALALRLARAGARVCLLDRATFPSPTLSTHVLHTVAPLRELGVLDRVLASGAPLLRETRFAIQGVRMTLGRADDPGLCPRRESLDTALLTAAGEAGADVRCGVRVLEVLRRDGAVAGVLAEGSGGRRYELTAPVVVGADGRNSTIARAMGARRYLVTAAPRPAYFGYFSGVAAPPAFIWQRPGDELVAGAPTDGGLFLTLAQPSAGVDPRLRGDDGRAFAEYVGGVSTELGELLAGATPVGELRRMPGYQCYFRESAGPGWALVGDAGHFKDVTPGQGINDALRQAERLAGALLFGLSRPARLAGALRAYWAWRDTDAFDMYWFGTDLGVSGPLPHLVAGMLHRVARRPAARDALHEVLAHRRRPAAVFSPPRLLAATVTAIRDGSMPARAALAQAGALTAAELRRRMIAARRIGALPAVPTTVSEPVAPPASQTIPAR
ncbi:NAD(P)/FAD-dependent oxidoreductase [Phytohabitans rumicis]|uniref:FAD-dependent oxidoreductase n=1 Tax=Phytohabitans rumicis TaxID=1076125 RepID=A0A6V8LC25_9ACTN|nr:FAD-dependent monooxygenase [Phytohabitans rumicis]GFJ91607.1 FAD-dependent oxidoreductase [Phytohabitans rumicis]